MKKKKASNSGRKQRTKTDWSSALLPLFKKYGKRKHPLDYHNRYELIVLVILSSQMTDDRINALAPAFFKRYPMLKQLASVKPEEMYDIIRSVRSSKKKAKWLVDIAEEVGDDERIPRTMDGLTNLSGIGRKSANVIIRESGDKAEGVIVDLHVLRVVPRLGITNEEKPDKIEEKLMEIVPREYWNDAGMSLSFLGREICRPTDPRCNECLLNPVCAYYKRSKS
jgi:endonuclease-3